MLKQIINKLGQLSYLDMSTHQNFYMDQSILAAPTQSSERIGIIDSLRGFAILAILLLNILVFSMPGVAAWNPSFLHESGWDFRIWYFTTLIPEGTQRALFSMLFGAGVMLFTSRLESRMQGTGSAELFLRRQLWLLVFGLADIYLLLWEGDILFDYACYGIVLYVFRKLPASKLLLTACICFLLTQARENRDLYLQKNIISKGEAISAIDTISTPLTRQQKADLSVYEDMKTRDLLSNQLESFGKDMERVHGSYSSIYEYRTGNYQEHFMFYTYFRPWDVLTFMFLGMAFLKLGIITGQASNRLYWILCIAGLTIGLTLSWWQTRQYILTNYNNVEVIKRLDYNWSDVSRCFRAVGILGLLMLLYRARIFNWFFNLLKPVGQMAFTNYLTQSIICGLYFNGYGMEMFGKLTRHEIYLFVLVVWCIQIVWSHLWLRFFRFGPFEWAWRSLTYWRWQPFFI